jgi:hypothetical protein
VLKQTQKWLNKPKQTQREKQGCRLRNQLHRRPVRRRGCQKSLGLFCPNPLSTGLPSPKVVTRRPFFSSKAAQPSAIGHRPSAIGHQPSAISHRPSAIGHQPSAISHRPSAIGHQPSAIGHQPSAIGHQPSAISHRPSAISHQPSAIGHQPSAISHRPSAISHRPLPSIHAGPGALCQRTATTAAILSHPDNNVNTQSP